MKTLKRTSMLVGISIALTVMDSLAAWTALKGVS
jgi:hypothetical protein